MNKSNKIFLLAGRTGGPIIPLLAIFRNLEKIQQKEIWEHKTQLQKAENNSKIATQKLNQHFTKPNKIENQIETKTFQATNSDKKLIDEVKLNQKLIENLQKELKIKIENQFEAVIIGVKNGFERKLANQENLTIEFLPEAKLEILSFRPNLGNFWEILRSFGKLLGTFLVLIWSFLQSFLLILKHRPIAVLSSGSFLAIPVIWMIFAVNSANKFFHFFPKIKIITHQQDPLPGVASRLTFGFGDLQSCVFDYSKKFPKFKNAEIIPNPIDFKKFEPTKDEISKALQNSQFAKILNL